MKIILWFCVFTGVFLTPAFSHPPDAVNVAVSANTVAITVDHPVQNPLEHYIRLIEVRLNGEDKIRQTFTLQKGNQQYVMFIIPELKRGDLVEVEATCNKFGTLKTQETVE
ncbi:MAG: desulfoferrodoxin family protein [Candidatus Omnitrophica bacterium]|nr:desulfoferrodoxin family protein [Candidatus Omnitrophota bacterium]